MMTIEYYETEFKSLDKRVIITYLQQQNTLKPSHKCEKCNNYTDFVSYKRNEDGYAWICMQRICKDYKKYTSVRGGSFFLGFNLPITKIIKILVKYVSRQSIKSICSSITSVSPKSIHRIIKKLKFLIQEPCFIENKLGGIGSVVQVDETMLNYKCKSHRGRSPSNRTDALVIVEVRGRVTRVYAKVIPNKSASTILPIIAEQVCSGSEIHTDEHKSYGKLTERGYTHKNVCHKYNFVDPNTAVNIQNVESINGLIKSEIRKQFWV
ncbi:hypothetical protein DMUE_2059 [Dictyocoela muelleri]|nr:hypothetical protein DMUE_2059 [Dictyocoela muelleri]